MSTRKGQAASVTLLRREQLRSASAPTNTSEVRRKTVGRQSLSRLRRQLPLHKGAFSCGGGEGRTGASVPTTVEAGMG